MPHFSKEKLRENERAFEVNDLDYQCFNIIVASHGYYINKSFLEKILLDLYAPRFRCKDKRCGHKEKG